MHAPIESKFEAAAVQRAGIAVSAGVEGYSLDIPNRDFARHCDLWQAIGASRRESLTGISNAQNRVRAINVELYYRHDYDPRFHQDC